MSAATVSAESSPPSPRWRFIEILCAPLYGCVIGTASLLLCIWALTSWWRWDQGYDIYFWAWALSLLGLWLSPQLPRAKPADVLVVMIWSGAVVLRCWELFTIPGDTGDRMTSETFAPFYDMLEIPLVEQGGYPNVFQTRWGFWLMPSWVASTVTGDYLTGYRSMAAIWGALALAGTAMLARRLGGPPLAGAALLLLGLNWWDNCANRLHPIMAAAAGAAWTWWAVWRACSSGRLADAVLAGIIGGLAVRLYEPVKIILVTIPAWWAWHALVTPGFFRRSWHTPLIVAVIGTMTIWPVISHGGREYFFEAQRNAMGTGEHLHGELEAAPLQHMSRIFKVVTGDRFDSLVNYVIDRPLLNPLELALVLLGLLTLCRRWRDPSATMAPIWFAAACLAVSISSQPEAGRRLISAMPAIGILGGTGLLLVARWRRPWGGIACAAILAVDAYINWEAFTHWALIVDKAPK